MIKHAGNYLDGSESRSTAACEFVVAEDVELVPSSERRVAPRGNELRVKMRRALGSRYSSGGRCLSALGLTKRRFLARIRWVGSPYYQAGEVCEDLWRCQGSL